MKVLVTGGGGFIGAWIIRRLAEAGHEPVVFDMHENRAKLAEIAGAALAERITWHTGSIVATDDVTAAASGCEGLVHLAGILTPACRAEPVLGAEVNLIGTLNAFLAARTQGISNVAWMSSMGVFGPDGGAEPRPTTLYGAFKLGAEHAARAFWAEDGISSTGFRPYVVYGPGRDVGISAGPSLACAAAARGEAYTIPFSGPIDMIHADDVAQIFLTAVEAPPQGAEAMTLLGRATDTSEVATTINRLVPGAQITVEGPPMPIDGPKAEPKLARHFPDWQPMTLEQGLSDTIDFYRSQG
ncbi:MAG: NAD(P)-dependent oxidoreductase [Vannielia sp.]|uniref:NAD-dependent epimerase/dehydratase family protein n=1 Tax=Vannielia sp. TaxID=2813045 RepID=UPI003B8E394D